MARDITKLHPELQRKIAQLKAECEKQGLPLLVTSCIRDEKEQKNCYDRKTTKLLYPNSHHNWGTAFDFCRNVKGKEYNNSDKFFDKVGSIAKKLGLIWGGDFSHPDRPHCQLAQWGNGVNKLKAQYGSPEKFMATWNHASSTPSTPKPEQKPVAEKYTVKKGDTLSKIAKKLNTTYKKLAGLNNIKPPYIIRVGQVLNIVAPVQQNTYMKVANCTTLKCRKTANGEVVGYFSVGTKLEVLDLSNKSWYKVKGKGTNGKVITGYCGSKYMK